MEQHFYTGTSAWSGFSGEEFERKATGMAKARGYWPDGFQGLPAYALPATGHTCGKLEWATGTHGTDACV